MAIELVPLCTMRLQAIGAEHAALVYHRAGWCSV
jgi:hypothetical protein